MAKATAELCEVRLNILCVFEREEEGGGEVKWEGVIGRKEGERGRGRDREMISWLCCRKF